jgi:hypothetical protein
VTAGHRRERPQQERNKESVEQGELRWLKVGHDIVTATVNDEAENEPA